MEVQTTRSRDPLMDACSRVSLATTALSAWEQNVRDYLSLQERIVKDPLLIVNVNTGNTGDRTNYQRVRFGLGTTLLGDGYFSFDFGTENHAQTWVYDEYDAFWASQKA